MLGFMSQHLEASGIDLGCMSSWQTRETAGAKS